jgi:16S rRNA A1518/A1519 N6-dimethyltransferase RsmA/KsgA/DIM1 with predicted DNA glycosylase/AP lyase activity
VLESDVLQVDYRAVAILRGGPLVVVGNLPYYITSQILFSFVDCAPVVRRAVVTMQWEVAQRLVAKPRTPDYGILSVVFQLYAKPTVAFKIPPTVFYPQPKVDSALCVIDFWPTREPFPCAAADLRRVITAAFQQRRKMLRQSLKPLLKEAAEARQAAGGLAETASGEGAAALLLPEEWGVRRPEELKPEEFLELTLLVFGAQAERAQDETRVWRHAKHGDW